MPLTHECYDVITLQTCVNFHDEDGSSFSKFKLAAGDDAGEVSACSLAPYDDGLSVGLHDVWVST